MHTTTAATPAASSAVVTPTIDELEQASFYSSAGVGIVDEFEGVVMGIKVTDKDNTDKLFPLK